ncbi:MAG: CRISPR-associated helicase Cas3' [bacterium]
MDIRKFWAKKNNEGKYHPLIFHSIDVGNVFMKIWNEVLSDKFKSKIVGNLKLPQNKTDTLLSFIVSLHDIGKLSPMFQKKDERKKSYLENNNYDFPSTADKIPHEFISAKIIRELFDRSIQKEVSGIVGAHHGIFPTSLRLNQISRRHLGKNSEWDESRKEMIGILTDIFSSPDISMIDGFFSESDIIILSGLIVVSDWVASNENYFPYVDNLISINEYFKLSNNRAKEALEKSGWVPTYELKERPESFEFLFEGKTPSELQKKVIEIFSNMELPDFLLLEWPMGEGKTESAFWSASHWFMDEGQRGIYMALPTCATSNQMLGRAKKILNVLFPNVDVALIHGLSELIKVEQESTDVYEEGDDEEVENRADIESWFSHKKLALLQQFGVGTIDQALFSVLRVKHFFLRLFGLAGKTVILDEVHAYDTYTSTLILRLIEWLRAVNSRVVLLSATLPSNKRLELINAYTGKDVDIGELKYPSIIATYGEKVYVEQQLPSNSYSLGIDWIDGPNPNLKDVLENEFSEDGCVVIIMNTIRRAQEMYKNLKENLSKDIKVQLLHARFPYEDREKVEKRLLEMYGPPNKSHRPKKSVLVSTQVVEQSMDLDFDVMISDLAPIDLLLQRAGRLHRHNRGKRRYERKLWIIEPELENGVPKVREVAIVYEPFIVLKTWCELKKINEIKIHDDVSGIIDSVYVETISDSVLEENSCMKNELKESFTDMKNKNKIYRHQSLRLEIPSPKQFDVLGMDEITLIEDDPHAHDTLRAATRKGGPSINVICLRKECEDEFNLFKEIMETDPPIKKLPLKKINNLLRRSCNIDNRGFVNRVIESQYYRDRPNRRIGSIRFHIPLLFEDGKNEIFEGYRLILDSELGLIIEREEDKFEE